MSYLKTSHFGNAVSGIKSFKGLNTVTEKSQKFSLASAFSRILIWKISEIASEGSGVGGIIFFLKNCQHHHIVNITP